MFERIKYMDYNLQKFTNGVKDLEITLTDKQLNQFLIFYKMMVEKNKFVNLTTITEFEEVVEKHFLDSLCLIKSVDLGQPLKILDLGTGAGFPGIPLKIAFPQLEIILMDSLNKRVLFLQDVISELSLTKISALHGRAEEIARKPEYREQFDICVSRAVANLSTLSEYCIPFVKQGGLFISYKSGEIDEEVSHAKKALHLLGSEIQEVEKFVLPGTEIWRSFVKIKKNSKTSKSYPRRAGTPTRDPL